MKKIFLIIILYISFSIQIIIKNGVYNILYDKYYLQYFKRKIYNCDYFKYPNTFYRINKISNLTNESFYYIEEIFTKYKLIYLENKELIFKKKNNNTLSLSLWNVIKTKNNMYIFRNKNQCYIKVIKNNITICDNITIDDATQFNLIKIYEEVEENNIRDYQLIQKEPIDILIKYIDLRDPYLERSGIHQIAKDIDNEELRYSIRSILKNIPWVRKIFILMPNEKVRFFKDYELIKDRIVYIKDKDLLGFDSSNSLVFQFRYWKMKDFGISDNIIVMDDDCFIGNPLKKTDFFYVREGKVIPSIITSNFVKIDRSTVKMKYDLYKEKALSTKEEQNDDVFNYSRYSTYLFILDIFNKSLNDYLFIPKYTHNAIPINVNDIKDIYDIIYMSKYKSTTLYSLYRHVESLQFQIFVLSYTFIKYEKRVKDIPYKFIKLNNSISANYHFSLFCINKGPGNYSFLNYYKAKIAMEFLFPIPSPYEIIDYSFLNISFNTVYSMDNLINIYEKEIQLALKKGNLFFFETILFLIVLLIFIKMHFKNNNNYNDYNYD